MAQTSVNAARQIPLTCSGHTRPVVDLQYSSVTADGSYYLISACKDGNPILRDGKTGDWIGTFLGHKGAVWGARLSKDAAKAVTGSADFTAKVWDTYSGEILHSFTHGHIVRCVDFSADGSKIVTGGHEKKLRIFDLKQPTEEPVILEGHTATIKAVLWDHLNEVIISASDDKTVKVWDTSSLSVIKEISTEQPPTSLGLTIDGQSIAITFGKTIQFWDVKSYELKKSFDMEYEVSSVSLHPDHSRFVVGGTSDLWVRIYDYETGKELEVYKGHHGPVHTVSYSPDGEIYATGSEDGTIRLWLTIPGRSFGLWQPRREDSDAEN
ncbi:WD40 repeat-like protein [Basidiobolus meristosporus CBS 931.73]|uniref:Serine-threonine kinase receptor-associated protein n=1 Tax=Basidiobolus meristosporus CBS 931.73 TaxID=1314790 RepID=A0A1Y1XTY4_9FUNG|nr:WD40 repeat-like protein [Basidiobolus meristosporus CBS 931.73]|eukprot:ORX89221.1 WD40 repeat-like protein [Basidiobolus meristosporus CBS 931.73]